MPSKARPTCHALTAQRSCPERYAAIRAGRFRYDFAIRGWLWLDSTQPMVPWTICPWCGHHLPTLTTIWHTLTQADGSDDG